MKLLPCKTCHRPALASANGILHSAGSISGSSLSYLCKRCGRLQRLTSPEFSQLPRMTDEEIAAASCDITPGT